MHPRTFRPARHTGPAPFACPHDPRTWRYVAGRRGQTCTVIICDACDEVANRKLALLLDAAERAASIDVSAVRDRSASISPAVSSD